MSLRVIMMGESLDRKGGIVSIERLILETATPDVAIKHIATVPDGTAVAYKVWVFLRAMRELLWDLSKRRTDLIHLHVSDRGSAFRKTIIAIFGRLFNVPVIIHSHSGYFHVFYGDLPGILKQWFTWSFRGCARFVVLSESWKTFYVDKVGLKPDEVVVLPNAVKMPVKILDRDESSHVSILFLGRMGLSKGTFDLIHAFAAIPVIQQTRAKLTIAGDGLVEQARSLVTSLNMNEHITVLDWIDEKQRDDLLAQSHVFVLPTYHEGLPMAMLEAMSWGLPVITTPVGGIPEVVIDGRNGLLVQPGDIAQLTNALEELIADADLRKALGDSARQSVAHFNISDYFTGLKGIYASVLGMEGQPPALRPSPISPPLQ